MFGSLDGVQYREWQRLGFSLPENAETVLDDAALQAFFARVPRVLNLRRPGTLASMVKDVQTAEASARTANDAETITSSEPAVRHAGQRAGRGGGFGSGTAWKVALLVVILPCLAVPILLLRRWMARHRAGALAEARAQVEAERPRDYMPAPAPAQAVRSHTSRDALSFQITTEKERVLVEGVHAKLNELTGLGVNPNQMREITMTAERVHAMARKEGIPDPLVLVKEYIQSQIEKVNERGPDVAIGSSRRRGGSRPPPRRTPA